MEHHHKGSSKVKGKVLHGHNKPASVQVRPTTELNRTECTMLAVDCLTYALYSCVLCRSTAYLDRVLPRRWQRAAHQPRDCILRH
jgi:hypothetical protein